MNENERLENSVPEREPTETPIVIRDGDYVLACGPRIVAVIPTEPTKNVTPKEINHAQRP